MYCSLGFVSELTFLQSANKLDDLLKLDTDPIAICDNANLGNLVALAKSGKRFIPAVELYTTATYIQSTRPSAPVVIYAFDETAYTAMCRCVAIANRHKRYDLGRISIDDLAGTLAGDYALVVSPEHEYLDLMKDLKVYLYINSTCDPKHSSYLYFPAIFWYQSHALNKSDLQIIDLLKDIDSKGKGGGSFNSLYYYDSSHFNIAAKIPSSIEAYHSFSNKARTDIVKLSIDRTPKFDIGNSEETFETLVRKKLTERYPNPTDDILTRLEFELKTIKSFGFADYFLVLYDVVSYARRNNIGIGPGRGSAAGSIVSYILGITRVDPLRFGLLFERFLNPGRRGGFPDIDIDVDSNRRLEVIHYLSQRYGSERVAAIITYNKIKAKNALKDAAKIDSRVHYLDINTVTKSMYDQHSKLDDFVGTDDVDDFIASFPQVWRDAKIIEGFCRQSGLHAAGIVVAPSDLKDMVGLSYDDAKKINVCQLDMKDTEKYGLLKLDLLGLETISLLARVCEQIGKNYYDLDYVPLDDLDVFKSLHGGNGLGLFQLEETKVQSLLKQLRPVSINDLAIINALNRPGPLQSGLTRQYAVNKSSKNREYLLPEFETLLSETCGVFVFQEQVMLVACHVASFSLAKADVLRKAIGKKDKELMDSLEAEFIGGAVSNGYPRETIEELWRDIVSFADYCFNKSHSVAYSVLSYWGAYLRHYHPREFVASCLTSKIADTNYLMSALPRFAQTTKYYPPDVNDPSTDFRPYKDGVQIGLLALKGMGATAQKIVDHAPFAGLGDFCAKVSPDKTQLLKLCLSGALDCFGEREVVHGNLELAMKFGKESNKVAFASLFDAAESFGLQARLRKPIPGDAETTCYGFSIFESYLTKNSWWLGFLISTSVVGIVIDVHRFYTKTKNEEMAFASIVTANGEMQLVIFPSTWKKKEIFLGKCYAFEGRADTKSDEGKFIVDEILPEECIAIKSIMVYSDNNPMPDKYPEGKILLTVVTEGNWRGDKYNVSYTQELHQCLLKEADKIIVRV